MTANPPSPARRAALQPQERTVLCALSEYDIEEVPRMADVAERLNMRGPSVKRAVRRLARKGMLVRTTLFSMDDTTLRGSGYILTPAGLSAARAIREGKDG